MSVFTTAHTVDWEKVGTVFLVAGLIMALGCSFLSVFLLSLGYDEAWILGSVHNLFSEGNYSQDSLWGPTTTGGLYTLVEGVLYLCFGNNLWISRLFPLLCLLLLFQAVWTETRSLVQSRQAALVALCVVVAVPGTLTIAVQAYGVVPATLLLFYGARLWQWAFERNSWRMAVAAGFLFGLAAATRLNFLVIVLAIGVCLLLRPRDLLKNWRLPLLVLVFTGSVFASCFLTLNLFVSGEAFGPFRLAALSSGFLSSQPVNFALLLNKWELSYRLMPLPLWVAGSLAVHWSAKRTRVCSMQLELLIAFAWALWLVWMIKAPIAHLRYVWPALFLFAMFAGISLAQLFDWAGREKLQHVRIGLLVTSVAFLVWTGGITLRQWILGDTNLLSWEYAGQMQLESYLSPKNSQDQRRVLEYLETQVKGDEWIGVVGASLELGFLSDKKIIPVSRVLDNTVQVSLPPPKFLILTPFIGRYTHLSSYAAHWIEENCELDKQDGRYVIYRLKPGVVLDPVLLKIDRRPYLPIIDRDKPTTLG